MQLEIWVRGETTCVDHLLGLTHQRREDLVEQISSGRSLWDRIGQIWIALSAAFHPITGKAIASEDSRISLALALAKLERNLIAGIEEHQAHAV